MEQIRKDLNYRINDQLRRWVVDSIALYDMGGIDRATAATDIMYALVSKLVNGALAYDISANKLSTVIRELMEEFDLGEKKQEKKKKRH